MKKKRLCSRWSWYSSNHIKKNHLEPFFFQALTVDKVFLCWVPEHEIHKISISVRKYYSTTELSHPLHHFWIKEITEPIKRPCSNQTWNNSWLKLNPLSSICSYPSIAKHLQEKGSTLPGKQSIYPKNKTELKYKNTKFEPNTEN